MVATPSLLLITVDCLRADHTGFLGYQRPTTPFMDSLARESLVFRNAIAAGVPTYYAFPAILASRHPLALGRDVVGIAPEEPTLATAFQDSGYATAAFLAGNPYLSKRFGYHAGFDTFVDFLDKAIAPLSEGADLSPQNGGWLSRSNRKLHRLSHQLGPMGPVYDELYFRYCQLLAARSRLSLDELRRFPAANEIVDHACDWLKGIAGRPFFLWLHFMDAHGPYYPPGEARKLMGASQMDPVHARYLNSYWNRGDIGVKRLAPLRDEIVDLYDAGIRWVDVQVARLLQELQRLHLWDRCIMAFTADHGEEFLDHGGRFHSPSKVYEELSHVPLLLRIPATASPRSVEPPFSLVDLAPTLLEIADVPTPFSFHGTSRWPQLQTGEGFAEAAIIESVAGCTNPFHSETRLGGRILGIRETRYKLVVDHASSKEWLFDLDQDPKELAPLSPAAEKSVRLRLLDRARRHLADSFQSRDNDHRLAARLRDLRLEWSQPTVR
jgi:arylsulfatase A-like enzyme